MDLTLPRHKIPDCRRWWYYMALVSSYVIFPGLTGLLRDPQRPAEGHYRHPVAGLLMGSAIELTLFGLLFGLAFYLARATPEDLRLRWHGGLKPLWIGPCCSIALRYLVGFLIKLWLIILIVSGTIYSYQVYDIGAAQRSGLNHVVSSDTLQGDAVYFWVSFLLTSFVMAGFCEELWRAAFLYGLKSLWPERFGSKWGRYVAVIIAALFFGFGHFSQSPLAVMHACLMGLGFGWIMVYYRCIWPAVIAHGCFDAMSMLFIRMH